MDKLHKLAKGYIQIEEMSWFSIEVRQVEEKCNKWEVNTKTNSHKLDKRHKLDKS